MDSYIISGLAAAIASVIAYFVRVQIQRLDSLEKQMPTKMNEGEVRQILADKVDPIKEDMTEIKAKVDRVIDLLIDNAKK